MRMREVNTRRVIAVAAASVAALTTGNALAAGYSLKEQSANLQGASFAGAAAKAEDPSTIFYNPAGLSRLDGYQMSVSGAYLAPTSSLSDGTATRTRALGGSTISGSNSTGDAVGNALIASSYFSAEINPDWHVGLALTSPWGMMTSYDSTWDGRYQAVKSTLRTYNINPVVSYRVNPQWSVGAGVQFQRLSAHLTNAVDFGAIGAAKRIPGLLPGSADGYSDLKGSDWGIGYNAGILWEPLPTTRLGLNFRSAVFHELDGNAALYNVPAVLRAAFPDSGAKAKVTTPEYLMFGVSHDITSQWTGLFELSWTHWSRFKSLIVTYDNPLRTPTVTEENWKDSFFTSVGVEYKANEQLTLRTGVAYDSAPTPDDYRTPRIPDSDRIWGSVGATYKFNPNYSLSAAYTHIWARDATLSLTDNGAGTVNFLRGNLSGSYNSHVDIVALQLTAKF